MAGRLLLFFFGAAVVQQVQAQDASQKIWRGKSGDYVIEWTTTDLKATRASGGKPVFDAAAKAKKAWSEFLQNSEGTPLNAEFTYRLLSAVGPYLSVEESMYCDCGGAHPSEVERIFAVNLDGGTVSLTSLFPKEAVFAALSADPIVAKVLGPDRRPASLPELLKTLASESAKVKDCEYEFPEDLLSRFALYDFRDGRVSVRLGLPAAIEVCRGETIQLGLALPVPESIRGMMIGAKEKRSGLLMMNSPHNEDAVTTFQYSKEGTAKDKGRE